jgi:nitrite reductase (NO-forming)
MNKWVIGILIAIIIVGGGYFLLNNSSKNQPPSPIQQMAQPTTTVTTPTTASATGILSPTATTTAKTVTVTGTEYAFAPATITAKVGQPVTVMFKNNGTYPHNFTIAELGVHSETIQPGQQTTVTFTPTKVGSYTYECTVPGHADRGMKGTVTVQ